MNKLYDKRAVKILFDTYWTIDRWSQHRTTHPSDLAYAIAKGVMFPSTIVSHDQTLINLQKLCGEISPEQVGNAFLASLSARELALRSALGSFAVGRHQKPHKFEWHPSRGSCCRYCSFYLEEEKGHPADLNVLNFERLKWGGVRHNHAAYEVFDLEQFLKLPTAKPTEADVIILKKIFLAIRQLEPSCHAGHFEKAISGIFPSSRNERCQMIEILSLAGVIAYPGYRNYFDNGQVPHEKDRFKDIGYWKSPTTYWRARDGINLNGIAEYFPAYLSTLVD